MKKHITTNKYLLIDYGNTCIKAGILNKKLANCITVENNTSFDQIIKLGKFSGFKKVVFISSVNEQKTNAFIKQLKKVCNDVLLVTRNCFIKDIDFSNIKKDVVIGNDILLCAYYIIKNYKANALLCLGTVYFCVITKGKKIVSVQLLPNITAGLRYISHITSIPSSLIPTKYDKEIGLNTPDAFACGAKTAIEGYVNQIAKKHKLNTKQIIVSGGDLDKYMSLSKKYHLVKYATLDALAYLVKDKNL